jgi:ribonuclease R
MYRTYLMRDRVGEEYDGLVSGVTSFGVVIEIHEPFVEGMIKLENLPGGGFELDDLGVRLRAKRTGLTFALGDPVRVRIGNVSVARRRIDLALVSGGAVTEAAPEARSKPKEPKGRREPRRRRPRRS